jgi:hypothetical protein
MCGLAQLLEAQFPATIDPWSLLLCLNVPFCLEILRNKSKFKQTSQN